MEFDSSLISFVHEYLRRKKSNISELIKYIQNMHKICAPPIHVKSL